METAIIICLLAAIALLLHDRISPKEKPGPKTGRQTPTPPLSGIMGAPRSETMHPNANNATATVTLEMPDPEELDIEYDPNEESGLRTAPYGPDLGEEEEEWNRQASYHEDGGLALGVTFEELDTARILLQHEKLDPSQQRTAVGLVQKIQGTELFALLESSVEDASRRMAALLDSSLSSGSQAQSPVRKDNDLNDFDIGQFV